MLLAIHQNKFYYVLLVTFESFASKVAYSTYVLTDKHVRLITSGVEINVKICTVYLPEYMHYVILMYFVSFSPFQFASILLTL